MKKIFSALKTACDTNACENGGTCTPVPASPATQRTCACPSTHIGDSCESKCVVKLKQYTTK